ncbi:MAG: butyrate kinase [Elusimicrobium sp.]|jgi:butyrate kinase|nr:butyrate kinase [Elusimicrobium sp.]
MTYNILVINPGSTSDDIGYYKDGKPVFETISRYSPAQLNAFTGKKIACQIPFRKKFLLDTLKKYNVNLKEIDAVIGRGGLVKHIESGVYKVNAVMLEDLKNSYNGEHASNLGGVLAREIADPLKIPAFIADPVVVDEMEPLARYTGMPEIQRQSFLHTLNHKRVARLAANELDKKYENCNFVVVHAGGGVSVAAHKKSRMVDVSDGFEGAGPMTPQRSGIIPSLALTQMCFSGKYTLKEIRLKMRGRGGMIAYTGTADIQDLENFIKTGRKKEGSAIFCTRAKAKEAYDAMIYQIAKEIGAMAVVIECKADGIILTGGLAYSKYFVKEIKKYTRFITDKFFIYAGGDEKAALREAAERALKTPSIIKTYI